MEKGKIRVYACGGLGANIAKLLTQYATKSSEGLADVEIALIDTSRSNLINSDLPEDAIYMVEGLDGSGGRRAENAASIMERKLDILQQFKPLDLNVVISSGGGGSGSVISPLIVEELMDRDLPTIVITVGSMESRNSANNTLKTLMSFDNIASRQNKPIVMAYYQNDVDHKQTENDQNVVACISALRALYSRQNMGLDTKDLAFFLRFDKVTTYSGVRLAGLNFFDKTREPSEKLLAASVTTLAVDRDYKPLPFIPEVHYVGYLQGKIAESITNAPLHFIITVDFLNKHVNAIESMLNSSDEQAAARLNRGATFTRKGDGGVGNLVL